MRTIIITMMSMPTSMMVTMIKGQPMDDSYPHAEPLDPPAVWARAYIELAKNCPQGSPERAAYLRLAKQEFAAGNPGAEELPEPNDSPE